MKSVPQIKSRSTPSGPDNSSPIPDPFAAWLRAAPVFGNEEKTITLKIALPTWQWMFLVQAAAHNAKSIDEVCSYCLNQGVDASEWSSEGYDMGSEDGTGAQIEKGTQ
jgi:hypothetical protein